MANKRKLIQLEQVSSDKFEQLQKEYEKKKMQPPSMAQLANRAIRKGLAYVIQEVQAELK